jgi:predicted amidophosphoribosyltransferase
MLYIQNVMFMSRRKKTKEKKEMSKKKKKLNIKKSFRE